MAYDIPAYFSPSSLTTFLQCPKRFYFEKIEGLRGPGTDATIRGNYVHEVLESLLHLKSEDRTLDNARSLMRSAWDERWREETETLVLTDKELRQFRWQAWWCIENYFTMEDPKSYVPEGLEVEVQGRIEGVPIFGVVDRWAFEDGKIVVGDYKTGKVPIPKYAGEKKLQIMIYADLLEQDTGIEAIKMELLYVKDGKIVTYYPTEELRSFTSNTLVEAWDDMVEMCEKEEFPTNVGPLCDWCHAKSICPAWASRQPYWGWSDN